MTLFIYFPIKQRNYTMTLPYHQVTLLGLEVRGTITIF